ncbi:hypothetical protein SAMN06269185_3335 [Natronoarchaeum philippinense]|uniref:Uncharacterized protein n=1 Tax=Natronoarchaeum philippinense TaxID=558529 RepID=A0A285P9B9_NATPI|nr:hypothetical protein [Natronoarchaeum philippinense]SNZ18340.1 hypothetical protein SAMN06269185_3335 [Natronoarchaeum philippinense]
MNRFDSLDLGVYRGDDYFLVGYVEPAPEDGEDYDPEVDADNYGWSLVQKAESPLDENTEIVGMDTRHDRPHLDKEYLPPDVGEGDKVWLDEGYEFYRMRDFLLENWQGYADLHIYHNE